MINMTYENIKPILVVPAVPDCNGIRFLLLDDQINVDESMSTIIWNILKYSNGYNSISDISTLSGLSENVVNDIVMQLMSLKIMYDSREAYIRFHEISSFPDRFPRDLSLKEVIQFTASPRKPCKKGENIIFSRDCDNELSKIIFNRRSCRSFSRKMLNKKLIGNMCFHGYSINNHCVASGGGLYPIKLYVLVENDQQDLKHGYYEYNSEKDVLVKFSDDVDIEQLKYCFNDEILPFNSSVQIVIAADLNRQTYKYSNRGYRLTLIEAGQVAQNICLYCQKESIGTCELGGVLDLPIAEELNIIEENINPLLCIAVGYPSEDECRNIYYEMSTIQSKYVGQDKPIKSFGASNFNNSIPFFAAYAYYGKDDDECAGGTSTSYHGAVLKAIVEAYERKRSGICHFDYFGSSKDLTCDWISPYSIRPLTNEQINYLKLRKFNEYTHIHWTKGYYKTTNNEVFVPSDLIYYGKEYCSDKICFSDSSGIAAYSNYETAIKLALLELIERDAIMRNWYEKKSPYIIDDCFLPLHVKKRKEYWKNKNRKIYILDMCSKYAPTIQVIIVGKDYPYFVCGASAGFDVYTVINKALREAEYSLVQRINNPDVKEIDIENILKPEDHGLFYSTKDNFKKLNWLWSSNIKKKLPKAIYSYEQLLSILNPIIIDLSEKASDIKVVRVLSDKCVPISFGFKQDYYTHKELCHNYEENWLPHYFD